MSTNEELINFLVFAYFGEKYSEMTAHKNDLMIKICVERAYLDLSRTIVYSKSTSELKGESKEFQNKYEEIRSSFKKKIYEHIQKSITENEITNYITNAGTTYGLKSCQDQNAFDNWHKNVCKGIKQLSLKESELFPQKDGLSYGQAQKWLNMTLKYLVLLGFWENSKVEHIVKMLHVPVDSYIMEAANDELNIPIPNKKQPKKTAKYSETNSMKWSNWEYEEYDTFQKNIRIKTASEKKSPFEWEIPAWIRFAKKHKFDKIK